MANHITLKNASSFIRNVLYEATEMTHGQAMYFLYRVLEHAEAVADSERVQIPLFPEKELLLLHLADNPALYLALMEHPSSSIFISGFGTSTQPWRPVSITFRQAYQQCMPYHRRSDSTDQLHSLIQPA